MEIQVPSSSVDFDFNHHSFSPPSTPKGFGQLYFSAPTSPARVSEIYGEFDCEERGLYDFAFATTTAESASVRPADEIMSGGKIRPWKPLSNVDEANEPKIKNSSHMMYSQSPKSTKSRSPKRREESHPFEAEANNRETRKEQGRGRERVPLLSTSRSGKREARSLSPSRVSKYPWEEQQKQPENQKQSDSSSTLCSSSKGSSRRWRLKDFLLFRSASEGRASDKDPFRKYANLYKKHEAANSTGSPSRDSSGGVPASRRAPVSAHERHYTVNKAVSQDMKKKSFLPYKQGILGRLAFNPTVHALSHGFGSLAYGHR